jgi:cobalt-zinc-cadmium efflux system membrane fusion protein
MKKALLIIAVAFELFSCSDPVSNIRTEKKVCVSDSMTGMISIDTVKECNINDELKLSGEVSFDENKVLKLYPISSGQVKEVRVGLGDRVRAGQVLAVIRSADIAANYNDLHSASADVAIAKNQLDNLTSLYKSGISSLREYEEAKQNYEKSLAAENKISQQLHINGAGRTDASGDYLVVAPRSGYILEKKINQGGFIRSDNSDNLFSIGDVGDVWIWANVYESDIAKVKEGYVARVTTLAYPDSVFIGRVDKVSQVLDAQSKVMRVRIILPNKALSLKPEMFANVSIENKEGHQALCIPTTAIVSDFGKNYVIIYKDKCDLSVKEINIQKTVGGKSFLTGGLESGERVLSSNQVLFFRALMEQ